MSITESDLDRMILDEAAEPKPLPFSLLAELTNGFSDELEIGRGGFAVVYKAILENGDVAVKRLSSNTYMYEDQFHREIECLMKVKHKNIVRFLGYCVDTQGNVGSYNGKFVMADVQQRLLCFEYLPKGSLHDYIKDPSGGLDWKERYKIIKGICEGLRYLHQKNILHLDLKPGNILLDENMQPKITDFGLSRCFEEEQTRAITTKVIGTMGYLAPEYTSHVITQKFDLYSLGVIITEILTGMKGYQAIETILENWSKRLQISQDNPEWEQIKVCAEIGMECTKFNPRKRPLSMKHIMDRLVETEYDEVIITAAEPTELLVVHPLELYLPFEYKKLIPCSLYLTNNMNEPVAFRLVMDESEQPSSSCFVTLPVYGIVLPRTTYTLVVTTKFATEQVAETNNLILESTTLALGDRDMIKKFRKKPDEFLEKVKDTGTIVVHEVRLKAVSTHPPRETVTSSSSEPISPEIKMLSMGGLYTRSAFSLDINHSKQWIITGHDYGQIVIWNNQTQRMVGLFKVSSETVMCVKFIARKQWFVAGTDDGIIHVYDYEAKMQKIKSFITFGTPVESLIVHPTQPYLFSSHYDAWAVWDWSMDWKLKQTFDKVLPEDHALVELQLVFCPKDIIASTLPDNTIKVWSPDSTNSWYIFAGHSKKVKCLDFFTCYDREYLVSGSDDRTAKIWDMQKKICVRTLDSLSAVTAVLYEPKLQILILGSKDGCIYLWCGTNYRINSRSPRLERIVNIGTSIAVHSLACLMGRVVIGKENAVAIMNIDNDENNLQQSTNDYSEPLSSVYNYATRPAGDTTCEVMSRSSRGELLDVTLELTCFPCEPNECISWSLHLTNNTDEHVAFMLMDKRSEPLTKLPLYGIVPCKSSYTLIVSATKEELQETNLALILQSSTSGHNYASLFRDKTESQLFFEDAKEMGNDVHEVAVLLKADYGARQLEETKSKIITVKTTGKELCCLDVHPTERWIITGHANGSICTWNHDTQGPLDTLEVSERSVTCVKVIARKQWIVALTSDGSIHVYNCARVTTMEKIRTVRDAHPGLLDVHPIQPYVLSASRCKIFDWDKGWESRNIQDLYYMDVIEFNQKDANMFAGAPSNQGFDGQEYQVQVWNSVDSSSCECSLFGHLEKVNCLHFFARDDAQFLISGSSDCTAKIWDWQKRECIHTMEILSPVLCVISLPDHPYLVTGSYHGTVQLWSSTDFRLERTINMVFVGPILRLVCSMGSRRVVVGQEQAISILEIGSEEEAVFNEGTKAMSSTKRSHRRFRRKRN